MDDRSCLCGEIKLWRNEIENRNSRILDVLCENHAAPRRSVLLPCCSEVFFTTEKILKGSQESPGTDA